MLGSVSSVVLISVSVFDFDEADIGRFVIFPCKGDAPLRLAGIRVNRKSVRAMELVVMEGRSTKETLFVRAIQQEKSLRRLLDIHCSKSAALLLIKSLTKEELLCRFV